MPIVCNAWVLRRGGLFSGEGLDEITLTGATRVYEVTPDAIRLFDITPEEAGLQRCLLMELQGGMPVENAAIVRGILTGEIKDAKRDAVLLNSGAALLIAGKASSLRQGVELAAEAVDSNKAYEMLIKLIRFHECINNGSAGVPARNYSLYLLGARASPPAITLCTCWKRRRLRP